MIAARLIYQIYAFIAITLHADQVVSGLSLTFLGICISLVLGDGLSKAGTVALLPSSSIPLPECIPILGRIFFSDQNVLVNIGYFFIPLVWDFINRTRPGMHLGAVGDYSTTADALAALGTLHIRGERGL